MFGERRIPIDEVAADLERSMIVVRQVNNQNDNTTKKLEFADILIGIAMAHGLGPGDIQTIHFPRVQDHATNHAIEIIRNRYAMRHNANLILDYDQEPSWEELLDTPHSKPIQSVAFELKKPIIFIGCGCLAEGDANNMTFHLGHHEPNVEQRSWWERLL
jgi:hypothetical protein